MTKYHIIGGVLGGSYFVSCGGLLIRYYSDEINVESSGSLTIAFCIASLVASFCFSLSSLLNKDNKFLSATFYAGFLGFMLSVLMGLMNFMTHCRATSCFQIETPLYVLVILFLTLVGFSLVGLIIYIPCLFFGCRYCPIKESTIAPQILDDLNAHGMV
ncbi:MAG: hypothetical protein Hyperionvirus25_9 [Hyperionvirus sp.]|uniref:Uncharacterized protein n=1 Tax=Hyperionvirus sp. TaxID=2487770 RepID=A0A3G5AEW0_9VIRU|nr:MAG: hypothetical protein Hyperionvirus25_9 [Hyperionvirus sp.]